LAGESRSAQPVVAKYQSVDLIHGQTDFAELAAYVENENNYAYSTCDGAFGC
jgi:hypothetical protein